ncbi:DUF2207 domain-containing protein [Actinocorallia sp. A-T 12471]|uniref:DUF2207 domain-containing protein n=1 Tax=Actinocorallia sp. A-T 12471 TaxID=3089813 RepID=UPI0029D11B07|nr:DUF2207 domain-containing protein [Actinocorallia sp. A-T 12471]MDX6743741.1 DUF2207 domain-containing protein [Actinocorallia sp. A-T 12471]
MKRRPSPTGLMTAATLVFLAMLPVLFRGQQSAEASVPSFEAVLTVAENGTVHVRETFTVDFAGDGSAGLLRRLRQRDGDATHRIERIEVTSPTFAPVNLTVRDFMHERQLRIGAGHPVSGRHTYVLDYDVVSLVREDGGRDELLWNVLGPAWPHPLGEATVRIHAPAVFATGCLAGRAGAQTTCAGGPDGPGRAEFRQSALRPGEGMVVRAAFASGALAPTPPVMAPPHLGFTPWGWLVLLSAAPLGTLLHGRSPRPLRAVLVTAGCALVLWDLADDVAAGGPWNVAVDDKLLCGLMLLALGRVATGRAAE